MKNFYLFVENLPLTHILAHTHTYTLTHTHCSSWDKKESILYLLLEYAETDLASIIKNQEPSIPTALYFWNEMLRIMTVNQPLQS